MINWILKIVADLSAPISRLWLRKINKDEQPDEIRRKKSEQIDREIAADDAESAKVKAFQAFEMQHDGWFIPDARWKDLNEALTDCLP